MLRPAPPAQPWRREWIDGVCLSDPVAPDAPDATQFGELTFLRGYELFAVSSALGGLSGLEFSDDGALYAVTDSGVLISIDVDPLPDAPAMPSCRMIYLAGEDGQILNGKSLGDAEGLSLGHGDDLIVSFEREHRVSMFRPSDATERVVYKFPRHGLENNQSLEALTAREDLILVGSESPSILGQAHPVWRLEFAGTIINPVTNPPAVETPGSWRASAVEPPRSPSYRIADRNGYGLVGFATTPHGALLTLHRFYSDRVGTRIRIGYLDGETAWGQTTGIVDVAELFYLDRDSALPVDNFEGIAARAREDGLTEVWIVSDDNFNGNQRQLLYGFTFDETGLAAP